MAIFDRFTNKGSRAGRQQPDAGSDRAAAEDPARPSPRAVVYRSELDFMSRCILDYPNIETGGELFGFWTQGGTPVVMYAVGPGPRAMHHQTSFIQDPDYVDNIEVQICRRTGLLHIGQWHSHHQLSLAHPSGGDVATMDRGVGRPGFPRMLLCIGNCTPTTTTVNAFNFHENTPGRYVHARWQVIDIDSPFRALADAMFGAALYTPRTRAAAFGEMHTLSPAMPAAPRYRQHWLVESIANIATMKGFMRSAQALDPLSAPASEITDSGEPMIALYGGRLKIMLPYGFPEKAPMLSVVDGRDADQANPINAKAASLWASLPGELPARFDSWLRITLPPLTTLSPP